MMIATAGNEADGVVRVTLLEDSRYPFVAAMEKHEDRREELKDLQEKWAISFPALKETVAEWIY
ncbi:hypothetical protein N7490_011759 [Penicillium lividum]|nr:hypothetical protein N7490_011759 [Penicillium lividum]